MKSRLFGVGFAVCLALGLSGTTHADIIEDGAVSDFGINPPQSGNIFVSNGVKISLRTTTVDDLKLLPNITRVTPGSLTINDASGPIHVFSGTGDTNIGQDGLGALTLDGPEVTFTANGNTFIGRVAGIPTGSNTLGDAYGVILDPLEGKGEVNVINGATLVTADVVLGDEIGIGYRSFFAGELGHTWSASPCSPCVEVPLRTEGTITVDSLSSWYSSGGVVTVGNAGTGTVNLRGTWNSGAYVEIGGALGGLGAVNVSGANSQLDAPVLLIGRQGNGELNIAEGSVTTVNGASIGVYDGIQGAVSVSEGGSLSGGTFGNINVGGGDGVFSPLRGTGLLSVSGIGSTVDSYTLAIGYQGVGMANVSAGGGVNSGFEIQVGKETGSIGTLEITAGGTVSTKNLYIGNNLGATGEVVVSGSGSTLITEGIALGWKGGDGTLRILDGAQVVTDEAGTVSDGSVNAVPNFIAGSSGLSGSGSQPTRSGLVELAGPGSKWTILQNAVVSPVSGLLPFAPSLVVGGAEGDGPGTLIVGAGTEVELVAQGVTQPVVFVGTTGTISGDGTITGNVFLDGGVIAPGASPGSLTIDGNLVMESGNLEIEVAGLGFGQFDVLDVSGFADLQNGTVLFSFIDDFLPQTGDTISFLNAGFGINTGNVNFDFVGVDPAFEFFVSQNFNSLDFVALNDATPVTAVPLPPAVYLFGTGLIGLAGTAKRKAA